MSTLFKIKLTAVLLLTAGALSLRADNISGSFSNDCTGLVKLWDLSGTYNSTNEDQGQTETETMVLTMDARGVITGSGHFDIVDPANGTLQSDFTAAGKVTSAGGVVRVHLVFVANSGTGQIQGQDITFKAKLNDTFELDDSSRALVGTTTGKIKVTVPATGKTGSKTIHSTPAIENLPDEVDGAWGVSLTAAPTGNKYSGASTLQLSNGKTFDLTVSGTYSTTTDLSKISLKSTDKTAPMILHLVEENLSNTLSIHSINGKALGQKLQFAQ
jgi:hypothetical protein